MGELGQSGDLQPIPKNIPQLTDQEKSFDITAALFSHPDTPNPDALQHALRTERMSINSAAYFSRITETRLR